MTTPAVKQLDVSLSAGSTDTQYEGKAATVVVTVTDNGFTRSGGCRSR